MTAPRKGAASRAAIPPDVLAGLNAGTLAAATLAEGLAVDFAVLLAAAFPDVPADRVAHVRDLAGKGVTRRMEAVGVVLLDHLGLDGLPTLLAHSSDTVRGWACYVVGLAPKLKLKARLDRIRPLADDPHFGVREWAWLAVRPHLAENVGHAVVALRPWTVATSANLRRFAVESTRPRGVWATHIEPLKQNPELGRPLLEALRADPSRYVQDSVANWLNDAAKTRPDWVRAVCAGWLAAGRDPATEYICRRAVRSL